MKNSVWPSSEEILAGLKSRSSIWINGNLIVVIERPTNGLRASGGDLANQ